MKPSKAVLVLCFYMSRVAFAAENHIIALEPASTPPGNISLPVDPSFAGFSIEPSNLFSFTGAAEPNVFTFNLLSNLAGYTGKPPHIRLGGNTQDYIAFQESQKGWKWTDNHLATGHGKSKANSILIGPRFFETANRLPNGTTVTWGLNLAYDQPDYIDQIVATAKQALSRCPNLTITSFEIGNEPDLYSRNGFRTSEWGGKTYTKQWLERAAAVWEQVLKPSGYPSNFFEAGATASTIGTDFRIQDLVGYGIPAPAGNDSATPFLSGWNQHDYYYFIGVSGYPVTLEHLMELQTTEDQFTAWLEQVQQAAQTPYPYALREMGIVGPIGLAGVTDVFGAALWTLNFLLYASSVGVSSVGFHMTDNSNASAWQPVPMYDRPPHVRPLYYGIAAFDQVIGPSCSAQVAQYGNITGLPAGHENFVRAYSVYQQGHLASIVVVNSKTANASSSAHDKLTVQLKLPADLAGQTVFISYLTSPGADASEDTTWNGVSFEHSGDGTPTQGPADDDTRAAKVGDDGTVSFPVRDSEAAVANLGKRIGSDVSAEALSKAASCAAALGDPARPSQSHSSSAPADTDGSTSVAPTVAPTVSDPASSACLLPLSPALIVGVLML
ncbi:hypothetical protein AAE478_005715 [Parahypoxylon ruwenzoriense]